MNIIQTIDIDNHKLVGIKIGKCLKDIETFGGNFRSMIIMII
jgi:hypothetical protein